MEYLELNRINNINNIKLKNKYIKKNVMNNFMENFINKYNLDENFKNKINYNYCSSKNGILNLLDKGKDKFNILPENKKNYYAWNFDSPKNKIIKINNNFILYHSYQYKNSYMTRYKLYHKIQFGHINNFPLKIRILFYIFKINIRL